MAKIENQRPAASTRPPEKRRDGEIPDAALDQVSGGTTGMISTTMKANSETQSSLAANLKAS